MPRVIFQVSTNLNTQKAIDAFKKDPAKYLDTRGVSIKNNVVKAALTKEAKMADALGMLDLDNNPNAPHKPGKGFNRIG